MIKVRCEVAVTEVDGESVDSNAKNKPVLVLESDWRPKVNAVEMIVLVVGDHRYTINGSDVEAAVKNARNQY